MLLKPVKRFIFISYNKSFLKLLFNVAKCFVNLYSQLTTMKKLFTLIIFSFAGYAGFAQVSPDDAAKRVGDSITVCGKIFGGRYFETSNGSPTLLNMGAPFPASPLTIMVPGEVRNKMGYAPEIQLKDKNVCITGRIQLFKDKPEIIIYNSSQLKLQ